MGSTGALFAAQALMQGAQTYSQVQASKTEDAYQRSAAGINARLAELGAEDSTRRGEEEASAIRRRTRAVAGSQRAAYAAQGIDVNSGTAGSVQEETAATGAADVITAKNNAWREAWGYRVEAQNIRTQSEMQSRASKFERRMTVLTGGMNILNFGAQASSASKTKPYRPKNPTEARFNREQVARRGYF